MHSPEVRSRNMRAIRGKNTTPETLIRSLLESDGFRLIEHAENLPGKPDLLLHRHRIALFVQGCFWHGHDCHLFKWPKTRADFWIAKIEANRRRDEASRVALIRKGWRVLYIWECALKGRCRKPHGQVLGEMTALIHSDPVMLFAEVKSSIGS